MGKQSTSVKKQAPYQRKSITLPIECNPSKVVKTLFQINEVW